MKECIECGKKLGILKGYRHPALGRNNFVCGGCFDVIEESMTQWQEFVLANSFNVKTSKGTSVDWKKFTPNFSKIQDIISSAYPEKEIIIEK